MFFSVASRLVFCLTLLALCFPSVLAQHARSVGKRDTFADSGLSLASWIWLPEPDLLTTAPTGNVAFLKTLTTPTGKTAAYASIAMTVDNNFTLWVNAQPIGASDGTVTNEWENAQVFTAALNASANVFSVMGSNTGTTTPNPAGLLAAITVFFTDSTNQTVLSDSTWLVSGTIPADFPVPVDVSAFVPAEVAGKYGSGEWATSVTIPAVAANPLNLTGSEWLWSISGASSSAPVGTVGFRKTIVSASGKSATAATVLVTADNTFQLFVNGQYIGAPPFDNNLGTVSSWQYAQLFTDVVLTPSSNIFTVLATNFESQQTPGGPSSAGFVAAVQITFSDGTTEIVRTDTSWLVGGVTTASAFLSAADSALGPAVAQGLFGISPWGTLNGVSNALNVLMLPVNNAAVVPTSPSSTASSDSDSNPAPASTTILNPLTSPSATPDGSGAEALSSGRIPSALVCAMSIIIFVIL